MDFMARAASEGACADRAALEEFVASMRVRGILDFQPAGARAPRMVATARKLAHDALEVVRARNLEEVSAALRNVVHVKEPGRH